MRHLCTALRCSHTLSLLLQVRRIIANPVAKKRFPALLAGSEGDKRQVAQLADLLERMVALDPEKRITPKEALRHPFIKGPAATASARK